MIILFNRKTFLDSVKRIQGLVDKNPIVPILDNLRMVVDPDWGHLHITATNLNQTGSVTVPLLASDDVPEGLDNKPFCIQADSLLRLLQATPVEDISLTIDTGREPSIRLTLPDGHYYLPLSEDAADFPQIPESADRMAWFEVKAGRFTALLERVQYAADAKQNDLRPAMFCIRHRIEFVQADTYATDMAATDASRLAKAWNNEFIPTAEHVGLEGNKMMVLWDRDTLKHLAKFITLPESDLSVCVTENHVFVEHVGGTFSFRRQEAVFPDVDAVIPSVFKHVVHVDRAALGGVLQRMREVTNKATWSVTLTFARAVGLVVSTRNEDTGASGKEVIGADYNHYRPFTVAFNAVLLADALAHLPEHSTLVRFGLNQPARAVVLQGCDTDDEVGLNEIHLLMPIQLSESTTQGEEVTAPAEAVGEP